MKTIGEKRTGSYGWGNALSETDLIRIQVNQTVSLLKTNLIRYYDALHELRRLTLLLLTQHQQASPETIDRWFAQEGFGVDADGFWLSLPLLERFRAGKASAEAISHSWDPAIKDLAEARCRMYSLRDIGSFVHEIHSRLPGCGWIYYQDATNTSIQFPYIDQVTAITPDFDWSTYHTFQSVHPRVNPERAIRWTQPTVDYAGEGVILSVSIPVYAEDTFIGVWSIDLPMNTLYQIYIDESLLVGQENYILDCHGNIIVHPSIETTIDREKGSRYQQNITTLGGGFEQLDFSDLLDKEEGELQLRGVGNEELLAYYGTVPEIGWIFLVIVPQGTMMDAVNKRINIAFEKIVEGDFSHRIDDLQELGRQHLLIDGYNKMAAALQLQEKNRLQAESALRESEQKYRQLFENANDAIFIVQAGRIIFANPKTMEMTGYAEDRLSGIPVIELIHPDYREEAFAHYQRTIGFSPSEAETFKLANSCGEELWVQLNAVRITWEGKEATLNFARDVTRQVLLEQQLHHAQKMDAIGKLASSIAHEFGNPLIGMGFAIRDIRKRSYLQPEDVKLLSLAEHECDRMRELIRDLQRFNRPTTGRKTTFRLHHLLDDLLIFHRRLFTQHKIRLVQQYAAQDIILTAVEDQLRQVFINLIFNAVDAMEADGGVLTVSTSLNGDKVTVGIVDNGTGIEPKALDHIFEPFYTTKSEVEGVGLGLPVSYGIIRAHAGEITVASKPGNTVFNVTLPL